MCGVTMCCSRVMLCCHVWCDDVLQVPGDGGPDIRGVPAHVPRHAGHVRVQALPGPYPRSQRPLHAGQLHLDPRACRRLGSLPVGRPRPPRQVPGHLVRP